jgi:hypothetical protein
MPMRAPSSRIGPREKLASFDRIAPGSCQRGTKNKEAAEFEALHAPRFFSHAHPSID